MANSVQFTLDIFFLKDYRWNRVGGLMKQILKAFPFKAGVWCEGWEAHVLYCSMWVWFLALVSECGFLLVQQWGSSHWVPGTHVGDLDCTAFPASGSGFCIWGMKQIKCKKIFDFWSQYFIAIERKVYRQFLSVILSKKWTYSDLFLKAVFLSHYVLLP